MFFAQSHDLQDSDDKTCMDENLNGPVANIFAKKDNEHADQCHVNRAVDIHQPESNPDIPPVPSFDNYVFELHFLKGIVADLAPDYKLRDRHSFTASCTSFSLTVCLPACSASHLLRSAISRAISSTERASSRAAPRLALAPVSLIILFKASLDSSPISPS
jgi:hypothetical protein